MEMIDVKSNTSGKSTADKRATEWTMFYNAILSSWAISRFKWEGLPSHIPYYWLEQNLLTHGVVYFYFSQHTQRYELGVGSGTGTTNRYGVPSVYSITGDQSALSENVTANNLVEIRSAILFDTTLPIIDTFAGRLANLQISLDIVSRAMRVNRVAYADDDTKLTVANLMKQIDQGENFIQIRKGLNASELIGTIDLSVDYHILPTLRDEANAIRAEFLSLMGIVNIENDKKERLVADEAKASNGVVSASRVSWLKPREEACKLIQEKFRLPVSVRWALDDELPIFDDPKEV